MCVCVFYTHRERERELSRVRSTPSVGNARTFLTRESSPPLVDEDRADAGGVSRPDLTGQAWTRRSCDPRRELGRDVVPGRHCLWDAAGQEPGACLMIGHGMMQKKHVLRCSVALLTSKATGQAVAKGSVRPRRRLRRCSLRSQSLGSTWS